MLPDPDLDLLVPIANMDEVGFYSDFEGLVEAFGDAESRVRPGFSYMLYNTGNIWQSTVTPALIVSICSVPRRGIRISSLAATCRSS